MPLSIPSFTEEFRLVSPPDVGSGSTPKKDVLRPMQYLGSKLRALDEIVEVARRMKSEPQAVLDIFSGTSVVSQALAGAGFRVVASDAAFFNATIARSLLGVGRTGSGSFPDLLDRLSPTPVMTPGRSVLEPWIDEERRGLERRDVDVLLEVSRLVPQIWRPEGASAEQRAQFDALKNSQRTAFHLQNLIAMHYAGTYFGLTQAAELDRLRVAIHRLRDDGSIGPWQEDVLLTALLSAASAAVFSPGKHFAQPHRISENKDLSFIRKRLLQDRSVDIWTIFHRKVAEVVAHAAQAGTGHEAYQATMEAYTERTIPIPRVGLIYADPPYTAQQYSRFYHVPETLATYRIPKLQQSHGIVTQGLYPEDRYKSRFCSKREAPKAFGDLLGFSQAIGANLMISYSGTSSGESGNDRMISLDDLLGLCRHYYPLRGVNIMELKFEYRQFNRNASAVSGRLDKEYIIVCERPC